MICLAVSGLDFDLKDLVVTILSEHEQRFDVTKGLAEAFGTKVRTLILDEPTKSQAETVAKTVEGLGLREPFLVKDSDNVFKLSELEQDEGYVCTESLNNFDSINPRNKSYLQTDHQGQITNIREKVVISDTFNVGGYYFTSPQQFLEYYQRLTHERADWNRELYLSDLIGSMILDGIPFRARPVTAYQDWGTVSEWRQALLGRKAYFVLLDGFVFERGSEHFAPRFADVKPNAAAIDALRHLTGQGHSLIYVSIRSQQHEALTRRQMEAARAPEGQIVWSCPIAQWQLLTAPHPTLPFVTSGSQELSPEDPNLLEKLTAEQR